MTSVQDMSGHRQQAGIVSVDMQKRVTGPARLRLKGAATLLRLRVLGLLDATMMAVGIVGARRTLTSQSLSLLLIPLGLGQPAAQHAAFSTSIRTRAQQSPTQWGAGALAAPSDSTGFTVQALVLTLHTYTEASHICTQ